MKRAVFISKMGVESEGQDAHFTIDMNHLVLDGLLHSEGFF